MRALVVLLLILNIAFAAWQLTRQDRDVKLLATADSGVEPLRLLTEGAGVESPVKPPESPRATSSPREPSTPPAAEPESPVPMSPSLLVAPEALCYAVGPFSDPQQVSRVAQRLLAAGIASSQRADESRVNPSYRVILPPLPSRESALQVGRQLAADGVSDFQVIVDDNQRNVIALGVFKDQPAAARRQAQIAAMGYAPRIEAHEIPVLSYWLDTREESQSPIATTEWNRLRAEYPEIGRRAQACH